MIPEQYDPRFMKPATQCRCGHILECCADCQGWLREHSLRISLVWRYYINHIALGSVRAAGQEFADLAEAEDCAYFGLRL